jgi:broad specificity phosphatase PhoE
MFNITFLRHAESDGNASGQIQGQIDTPLTELGRLQAFRLAQSWQNEGRQFDLTIASPLERARQTAQTVSGQLKIPIEYDPTWKERAFGEIEGRSYDEVIKGTPIIDFYHPYNRPGGSGESLVDLFTRAECGVQSLLRRTPGAYLVVTHGAMLNMILYVILGLSPHSSPRSPRFVFSNTGYIDLTYNPENLQWRIYRISNGEGTTV